MRTSIPFTRGRGLSQQFTRPWRRVVAISLGFLGVILGAAAIEAALNHRPFVSAITDQRISNGGAFATQYFRIFDYDLKGFTITKQSRDTNFLPSSTSYLRIDLCTPTDTDCAQDGSLS